jgi:hypothetical protein
MASCVHVTSSTGADKCRALCGVMLSQVFKSWHPYFGIELNSKQEAPTISRILPVHLKPNTLSPAEEDAGFAAFLQLLGFSSGSGNGQIKLARGAQQTHKSSQEAADRLLDKLKDKLSSGQRRQEFEEEIRKGLGKEQQRNSYGQIAQALTHDAIDRLGEELQQWRDDGIETESQSTLKSAIGIVYAGGDSSLWSGGQKVRC